MSKRSFGSIDQLPSGKWRARYTAPTGEVVSRTVYAKDDAASWLRNEERLIEFNQWTHPKRRASSERSALTVGGWLTQWLEIRTRGTNTLKESTLGSYRNILNNRILEVQGAAGELRTIPLKAVTKRDVAWWWDSINEQFNTPPTNKLAYTRLKTAMNEAIDRDLIEVNPCTVKAARGRVKSKRKELPEIAVMNAIVDQLDHSNPRISGAMKLLAILTLFHGLRAGEALALQRRDIIRHDGGWVVKIRRNAAYISGKGMILLDSPKTAAGFRDVPLFPRFNDDMREHLKRFTGSAPEAQLFTTAKGGILDSSSFRQALAKAKKRAGYDGVKLTPHYGRVWLITTLAEAGMPIPEIGRILGQVDLKTITEIYMRASESRTKEVLRKVGDDLVL